MKHVDKFRIKIIIMNLIIRSRLIKRVGFLIPNKIKILILSSLQDHKMRYKSFGSSNEEITFLVIGGHSAGLYSIIHNVIGYLILAKSKGYIPLVDYSNHLTFYHLNGQKYNIWEYFFEQPSNYSLEDVYSSKNVVFTPTIFSNYYPSGHDHIITLDSVKTLEINRIFQEFIHYNDLTKDFIESLYTPISKLKLIGVYVRGTDYNNTKGHHRQPEISKVFEAIDYFETIHNNLDGIYLVTEEQELLQLFLSRYQEKLYYQKKVRVSNYTNGKILTPELSTELSTESIALQGREYLADIEILSRLDYFIGGINNGSAAVVEKNGLKFLDYRIFFEGFQ